MTQATWEGWAIREEAVARVKSLIGVELSPKETFFNTEASKDGIRHFADGIGDPNPLWRDEAYATKTKYGRIVAPPNYLYTVYDPGAGQAIMGNNVDSPVGMFCGNDWEWYEPLLEGDSYSFTQTITSVSEKLTKSFGKMVVIYADTLYRNQHNRVVAKATGWVFRGNRPTETTPGVHRAPVTYTTEELLDIRRAYDNEIIRGANPRYWEDVGIGDNLDPLVKGPLSIADLTAFLVGRGLPFIKAHRMRLEFEEKYKEFTYTDPATGHIEAAPMQHMDPERAQMAGYSTGYDWGGQRMAWLINLMTHWIGDDGFLKRMYIELRQPNFLGETTWMKGKVTNKQVVDGEHLVDIDCWGETQDGLVTMPGNATVRLPTRH